MLRPLHVAAALVAGFLAFAGASAVAAESAYTRIPLSACEVVGAPAEAEDGATFLCAGYAGIPVLAHEGDLRWFVAYGAGAETHTAFGQTVSAFNLPFRDDETMVIEWRLNDQDQVYATILRYYVTTEDGEPGSFLVVTRLFPADSCQVAQIAAHEVADANVMARQIADQSLQLAGCPATPQMVP